MIPWRTGRRSVLVVCRYVTAEPDLVARLQSVYTPWFGLSCTVTVRRLPHLRTTLAVIGDPVELGDLGLWGEAVGASGLATSEELSSATSASPWGRDLLGSFALVRVLADRLRIVIGPDLMHALRHCDGPDGEAWSSHGLAAALAVGRTPSVVVDNVPELVLTDYVLADDDLLEGVRVLPEATVVEVTTDGSTEVDYWPVRERLLSRHEVSLAELRAGIGSVLQRLSAVPGLQLALTGGRDSTMLASCFAEIGVAVPTFTFGGLATPDGAGAAAVAAHLGWDHQCLQPASGPGSVERLLATTLWTEGLDTAWNAYGPPMVWPPQEDSFHLYGIGGEMGRAYYWSKVDPALLADPAAVMTGWLESQLQPSAAAALHERSAGFVAALASQGWEGPGILDGWHARGRVRKWPGHTPLPAGVRATLTAYPSAQVAAALLGLPVEQRVGAVGFDAAARLVGDLHAVAGAAVVAPVTPSRLQRFRRHPSVALAVRARRELGLSRSPVVEAFGPGWWKDLERRIPHEQTCHRWMWNSLAVEALSAVVQGVSVNRAVVRQPRSEDPPSSR